MKQQFLTPLFNIKTLRKAPKSTQQQLVDWHKKIQEQQLTSIAKLLGKYVPQTLFEHPNIKQSTRRRIFTLENTFWGFLLQTLQVDCSCQSVVHQLKSVAKQHRKTAISNSTSAYCQARKKLPDSLLDSLFEHTNRYSHQVHPLVKRRVVCADGTGLLSADTSENQARWPQLSTQEDGCGFPQLRLCALFNLHTGSAINYEVGSKRSHELPLLRAQEPSFQHGDIFLGDKGFTCYYDQARLLAKGVDSIVALSRRKPFSASNAQRVLGDDDLLVRITKFNSSTIRKRYPSAQWDALPEYMLMRQIKVNIGIPGYRVQTVYLLTTLTNCDRYPAHVIAELYRQRWRVELFFRDMKTTMGMEFIDAKSPEMVMKCIQMYMIAYNLIRALMSDADTENEPTGLSYKSCLHIVLSYANNRSVCARKNRQMLLYMTQQMSETRLLIRSRLNEPRVIKLRPKPFKRMMKSREILRSDLYQNLA